MAATVINPVFLNLNTAANLPATTAIDGTDGGLIDFSVPDHKALIILENASSSAGATATIKAGNGLQGVSDLAVSLAASAKMCIRIESMKYVNVSGENMGKVKVTGANVKAALVVLP